MTPITGKHRDDEQSPRRIGQDVPVAAVFPVARRPIRRAGRG